MTLASSRDVSIFAITAPGIPSSWAEDWPIPVTAASSRTASFPAMLTPSPSRIVACPSRSPSLCSAHFS
jgi:hypothetical protein